MTERTQPASDDIFDIWTVAEQEVWDAWSKVEQDVSRSDPGQGLTDALDAMEASTLQVAQLHSALVRGACSSLQANPLLPNQAHALVEQVCKPLLSLSGWQNHLISAWFGMARHVAMSGPPLPGSNHNS